MIGKEKCTKFHFQLVRSPAKTCNVVQSTGGHLIKARSHPVASSAERFQPT